MCFMAILGDAAFFGFFFFYKRVGPALVLSQHK